ncbi:hypothetical protein BGZ68_003835, partial [Mortierella alpina]
VRDRHSLNDAEDSWTEDPRRSERSIQAVQQGHMHSLSALFVHRQGHCHDSSGLSSTSQGSTSDGSQDPCTEIGIILGGIDLSATSSNGGTHVVAHSPSTVERAVMDCVQPTGGHLHRCFGLRMGSRDQQPLLQRLMDTKAAATTHQLQRIDDSVHCLEATRSQGTDSEHHFRQHHHDCLHQPLWRDEITATDGTSDVVMDLVSEDGDEDSDNIRPISLQPSGCSISTTDRTAGVVNRSLILWKNRSSVGPAPRRSLRIASQPPAASLHDVETHSRRHRTRRLAAPLETIGQHLPVPTLESNPSRPTEDQAGENHSDNCDPALAISGMVPDNQDDVDSTTSPDSSSS